MQYATVFVFLVLCAFAHAQIQPRCVQTPILWHGHFREIEYDSGFVRFADMDYDAVNKRIHVLEIERNRTSRSVVLEEWLDFQTREVYVRQALTCSRYGIPDDITWRPFGVPTEAYFIGREWLGAERTGLGLEVDQFVERRGEGYYHGTFVPVPFQQDEKTCVPVLESYVKTQGPFRDSVNVHYEFVNITTAVPTGAFDHCVPQKNIKH